MKKITFIAAIAFAGSIAMSSCTKSFTCTCKDKDGKSTSYELPKTKKSVAKTACNSYNSTYSYSGGSCSL